MTSECRWWWFEEETATQRIPHLERLRLGDSEVAVQRSHRERQRGGMLSWKEEVKGDEAEQVAVEGQQ